jgi:predicted SAM-dependent methyltransferase
MIKRLQLGTSRLENLSPAARCVFADESWIHLGDPPGPLVKRLLKMLVRRSPGWITTRRMYESTNFRPFYFRTGDRLPFEDDQFTYVFSEHFFEHLPLDLAVELFRECHRVLVVGAVLRTSVPDAQLRTYEPPEDEDFPPRLPCDHPLKHKVRWTVYSLAEALRTCGFRPIALDYCTREGEHIRHTPSSVSALYGKCPDWPIVATMDYVMRPFSLIVDGVKEIR